METGPFTKEHAIFVIVRDIGKEIDGLMGFTYENDDSYSGIWFENMEGAKIMRKTVNERIGWSILAKPEAQDEYNDGNPFTCDVVCVCVVPKDVADRNGQYDGDAMTGALMACVKLGIKVRI